MQQVTQSRKEGGKMNSYAWLGIVTLAYILIMLGIYVAKVHSNFRKDPVGKRCVFTNYKGEKYKGTVLFRIYNNMYQVTLDESRNIYVDKKYLKPIYF